MNDEVTPAPVLVRANGLRFGYPGLEVAGQVSHAWPAGLCLLEGDEGSGKSSWLKVLARPLEPRDGSDGPRVQAGSLEYALADAAPPPAHELFWQDPRAELGAAQREQVVADWAAQRAARYPRWSQPDFLGHVQSLGLQPHWHKPLLALSTGSLRKLWLAAAWASGAALTLIDEPLAALDKPSGRHVQQALAAFAWRHQAGPVAAGRGQPRCIIVAHWDRMQGVGWDDVMHLPSC